MTFDNLAREWHAGMAIARQASLERSSQGSNFLTWFFAAIAVLAMSIMFFKGIRWQYALGYGAGVPLIFIAIAWWVFLVSSLVKQNSAAARLVPSMQARLVGVLVGAGLLMTGVIGGLLALAVPLALAPLIAVPLLAGMMLVVTLKATYFVYPILLLAIWPRETSMMEVLITAPRDILLLAGAILVPLVWYLGITYFLKGQAKAELMSLMQARLTGQPAARSRPIGTNSGLMLLFGLGPRLAAPWFSVSWGFVGVALVLIVIAALNWEAILRYPIGTQIPAIACSLMIPMARALNTEAAIYAMHGEQALLRLAARSPAARQLNRVLARALLREFYGFWALWSVAGLVLYYLAGASVTEVVRMAPVFLMSLGIASIMLCDYARARTPYRWRSFWWLALFGIPAVGLCVGFKLVSGATLIGLAVGALALAGWQIRRRLALMDSAPVAFPTRRLA